MTTGSKRHHYLTHALSSVIGLADVDGNKVDTSIYRPRGVRILAQSAEPVAQPYRFTGNYKDPTGPYHLKARYYDANPAGLYSVADAVDDAGEEVPGATSSGLQGSTGALWGQAACIAVESACRFVAAFAGAPAVNVVAIEVGCAYASTAVGEWTASTVESNLES
ncbi:hypothetical protein ACFV19_07280 [Streptomyces griseoluteus]|uniref:hypothetical protein n=1 Tax=Streptomyces griseoluteus TaxID=29306 RepID=UPI0036BC0FBD